MKPVNGCLVGLLLAVVFAFVVSTLVGKAKAEDEYCALRIHAAQSAHDTLDLILSHRECTYLARRAPSQ